MTTKKASYQLVLKHENKGVKAFISGNVHRMSVQDGEADQWHHAYKYDADNRITQTFTNTEAPLVALSGFSQDMENELIPNSDWQNDATYYYYDHGPLARVELGENQLQGVDYVYNLQGWLKGVNSSVLDSIKDPGNDGVTDSLNGFFAKDVFGFGLSYFNGDYEAINGRTPIASINGTSHAAFNSSDLYNGNIRYMQTAIKNPTTHASMPMLNAYKYDQLNRLLESRSLDLQQKVGHFFKGLCYIFKFIKFLFNFHRSFIT